MIVCICEGLNDQTVRDAIECGAHTVRDVRKACGAGRQCGMCACDVREMLAEYLSVDEDDESLPVAAK